MEAHASAPAATLTLARVRVVIQEPIAKRTQARAKTIHA